MRLIFRPLQFLHRYTSGVDFGCLPEHPVPSPGDWLMEQTYYMFVPTVVLDYGGLGNGFSYIRFTDLWYQQVLLAYLVLCMQLSLLQNILLLTLSTDFTNFLQFKLLLEMIIGTATLHCLTCFLVLY